MRPWFKKHKLHMVAIVTTFGLVVAVLVPTEYKGNSAQTANPTTYSMNKELESVYLVESELEHSKKSILGNTFVESKEQELPRILLSQALGEVNSELSEHPTEDMMSDILSLSQDDVQKVLGEDKVEEAQVSQRNSEQGVEENTDQDSQGNIEEDGIVAKEETPAPKFYQTGVSHSSVADIQQKLMDLGFMDYAEPTMLYGPITAQSVKLFQRQNDLKQDGIIGPETFQMLFGEDAKKYTAKLGMSGNDIKRIQTSLYEMGYLSSSSQITGTFDETTDKAVKKMQEVNNLAVDGKVGQVTAEMLYGGEAKANHLSFGEKSDVVLAAQKRLIELGYLVTQADGVYGSKTQEAVKNFQSRNDLIVDGYLGPSTREVLSSSSAITFGMVLGERGDNVKTLQELLSKYGYLSSSNITGYFGDVTEAAVKAFQRNNGLSVDGNVGTQTINKLSGSNVKRANSSSNQTTNISSSSSQSNSNSTSSTTEKNTSTASTSQETSASVSTVIKIARSKVGSPYVWGSKGPSSFDCSGFVYWVLNQAGVKQSYLTSSGWRNVGKYQKITKFSDIKAGDIVVVRGHVGIAAGNGMVVDASSSSGKIVYRELGSWWRNGFIVAWRIF